MHHLLQIDCSSNLTSSRTRHLTKKFSAEWSKKYPGQPVTKRDLIRDPLPLVDEAWIIAAYKPIEQRTAHEVVALEVSDMLIDEFLAADVYVFGVPMYNLGIPAAFKIYIDQIIRAGRTLGPHGKPVVLNKKMLFITSRGGHYRPGTPTEHYDLQTPYLKSVFGMIGVTDVAFVNVEGQQPNVPLDESALKDSQAELLKIVNAW